VEINTGVSNDIYKKKYLLIQVLIKENLALKENMTTLAASNSLLRSTLARLEDQAATLKAEVAHCRANASALQALDLQLSSNSTLCNSQLKSAFTTVLGLEAGLILVVLWLLTEHICRPLWAKYMDGPFPIDRYLSFFEFISNVCSAFLSPVYLPPF
jgi:hypothetical protein